MSITAKWETEEKTSEEAGGACKTHQTDAPQCDLQGLAESHLVGLGAPHVPLTLHRQQPRHAAGARQGGAGPRQRAHLWVLDHRLRGQELRVW